MDMNKKTWKTALATCGLALMTALSAHADSNPANDSGVFTVRITPNVDLGVTVDTTGSAWVGSANLDVSVDLGADKLMGTPVAIAMAGNFGNQELTLTAAALNTWALDTDEVDAADQMRLYGMFGRSAYVGTPLAAAFDGVTNLIVGSAGRAGQAQADESGDSTHKYELSTGHAEYADVDGMAQTATRSLWLRSRAPSSTSTDEQAAFTVTVTAVNGVGL